MRLTLLAIALSACADYSLSNENPDDIADTDTPPDTAVDTGSPPPPTPTWFSVDGRMELRGGVPGEASELTVGVWGREDGAPVRLCEDVLPAADAPFTPPPLDEVTPFAMWTVSTEAGLCAGRPAEVTLGIGPLVPELWPAADQEGASLKQTRGLYVERSGLLVTGLAATADQAAGVGAPPSLDPLPDGRYHLVGVWLIPL